MAKTVNTGWRLVTPGTCGACGNDSDYGVDGRGHVLCSCHPEFDESFDTTEAGAPQAERVSSRGERHMQRWLSVYVYRAPEFPDCSNGGVSSIATKLYVPCPNGNDTDPPDHLRLIPHESGGLEHFRPACYEGTRRHVMFGGNFVWCMDSRFRSLYGDSPVAIHDRVES